MNRLKKISDKGWAALDVVGRQSNKIAHKLGTESFWPMPLDQECDKAAAILRTFTRDGFQVKAKDRSGNNTKSIFKIPPRVMEQAKGLVIFTAFRAGIQLSGAGGSGILIARQPDGTFGPPSGILLHTLSVGFIIGIDIYDTLIILRTQEAVNAFAHPKLSLGAEVIMAVGPLGSGAALDMGLKDRSPAWVYAKSKGLYAGVALDGTVMIERSDENERFYGRKIKAAELIKGNVRRPGGGWGEGVDRLVAAIKTAEGRHTGATYTHVHRTQGSVSSVSSWENAEPAKPSPEWKYEARRKPPLPTQNGQRGYIATTRSDIWHPTASASSSRNQIEPAKESSRSGSLDPFRTRETREERYPFAQDEDEDADDSESRAASPLLPDDSLYASDLGSPSHAAVEEISPRARDRDKTLKSSEAFAKSEPLYKEVLPAYSHDSGGVDTIYRPVEKGLGGHVSREIRKGL